MPYSIYLGERLTAATDDPREALFLFQRPAYLNPHIALQCYLFFFCFELPRH